MSLPRENTFSTDPVRRLKAQAQALVEVNRVAEAIPLLLQALATQPDNADLLCRIAYAHSCLGNHREALQWAKKAAGADPHQEWAHRLQAHSFWSLNRLKPAYQAALEAARVAPDEPQVHRLLTDLHIARKKLKEAQVSAERTRDLAPSRPEGWRALTSVALAQARAQTGRRRTMYFRDAEASAQQALKLQPDNETAMNLLAQALIGQNRNEEAIRLLHSAAALNPQNPATRQSFDRTAYTLFFLPPAFGLGAVFMAVEAALFRAGLDLWPSLWLGIALCALTAFLLVKRYGLAYLEHHRRFPSLPDGLQNTLRQRIVMRKSELRRSFITSAALISSLPALILGMAHSRYPQDYDAAVLYLNRVFHPSAHAHVPTAPVAPQESVPLR